MSTPLLSSDQNLRCTHCGRAVHPTLHNRDGWKVDYYLLHTGEVEPAVYKRGDEGAGIEYLRLIRPETVVTCATCSARPEVQAARLFAEEKEQ